MGLSLEGSWWGSLADVLPIIGAASAGGKAPIFYYGVQERF